MTVDLGQVLREVRAIADSCECNACYGIMGPGTTCIAWRIVRRIDVAIGVTPPTPGWWAQYWADPAGEAYHAGLTDGYAVCARIANTAVADHADCDCTAAKNIVQAIFRAANGAPSPDRSPTVTQPEPASDCGCSESYPQLRPGHTSHGPGCSHYGGSCDCEEFSTEAGERRGVHGESCVSRWFPDRSPSDPDAA